LITSWRNAQQVCGLSALKWIDAEIGEAMVLLSALKWIDVLQFMTQMWK
jgi:hypothetical protein